MATNVKQYRDEGYKRFQLKVGGDPAEDIERIRLASNVLETGEFVEPKPGKGEVKIKIHYL